MDTFAVLAEPTRRRIVERLREDESNVGDLVDALGVSQPTVSKHLKVLRDGGLVSCRTEAQQRIYRIEAGPFQDLDGWLAPYRRMWGRRLDALDRHLDRQENDGVAAGSPESRRLRPATKGQENDGVAAGSPESRRLRPATKGQEDR